MSIYCWGDRNYFKVTEVWLVFDWLKLFKMFMVSISIFKWQIICQELIRKHRINHLATWQFERKRLAWNSGFQADLATSWCIKCFKWANLSKKYDNFFFSGHLYFKDYLMSCPTVLYSSSLLASEGPYPY